ncbi:MAG: ABC transporter ATP-binding protein [Pseudomonadota bacterium]
MAILVRFDRVSVAAGDRTILRNLSFEIGEGEKAVFRGKSGSGKSTVLKTLLGVYPVAEGRVYFAGRPLDREAVAAIRALAAYIGQEPVLGADTVRQALLLPFTFKAHRGKTPSSGKLAETLSRLGLAPSILDQDCNRVSGGEKQRIAVARAQLLGKRLYLLDEVTSALDPESKRAVLDFFADPALTVLSVAHDPDWIARCDTVFELEDGRLAGAA